MSCERPYGERRTLGFDSFGAAKPNPLIGSRRRCHDFCPRNAPTISIPLHYKFISLRTPQPVERFVRKDNAALMRRECSVNWHESGNGNSCFSLQFVQSVRDTILAHEKSLLQSLETIVAHEIFVRIERIAVIQSVSEGPDVAFDSISKSRDGILNVNSAGKSLLHCSKGRVSVFFASAAQYIEVASNGKFACWNVGPSSNRWRKSDWICSDRRGKNYCEFRRF